MFRERLKNLPPTPKSADDADEFLTLPNYSSQHFAKYYQGLVRGEGEGERALTFAHQGMWF